MTEGQKNGTGGMVNLDDDKVRKDDILSNREKSQRPPGQSLDGKGVQVDEYKDIPTNQRPRSDRGRRPTGADESAEATDRPGFDLGGSTGKTSAGKGLGLGKDAKDDRSEWGLPRGDKSA